MSGTVTARTARAIGAFLAIPLACVMMSCKEESPETSAPPSPGADVQVVFHCFECGEDFKAPLPGTRDRVVHQHFRGLS